MGVCPVRPLHAILMLRGGARAMDNLYLLKVETLGSILFGRACSRTNPVRICFDWCVALGDYVWS